MINERTAGDDVHMQVEDRLPRGSAGIDDRTVSGVISQQLMGDARHGEQQTDASAWLSGWRWLSEGMCLRGMTRTCTGATGWISWMTSSSSSAYNWSEGGAAGDDIAKHATGHILYLVAIFRPEFYP